MSRLAAWHDAHRGPRTIVIVWLATRVLILVLLALFERFVTGDVFYYYRKINALFSVGPEQTRQLVERAWSPGRGEVIRGAGRRYRNAGQALGEGDASW